MEIATNGARLHYETWGNGEPLLPLPNVIMATGSPRLPLHNCDLAVNDSDKMNIKTSTDRMKQIYTLEKVFHNR